MAARNVTETLRPKPASGQTLKRCASRLELKAPLHGPLASVQTRSKRCCAGQSNNRTKARWTDPTLAN